MLLNDLTKQQQKQQKTNKTTKVCGAPCEVRTHVLAVISATLWANGPTAVLQLLNTLKRQFSFQVTADSDFKGYQLLW